MNKSEKAKDFLTAWWRGERTPRPALLLKSVVADAPQEVLPYVEEPFCPRATTKSLEYRFAYHMNEMMRLKHYAESIPSVRPYLGTCSLALYLGCHASENKQTVWNEKIMQDYNFKLILDDSAQYLVYQRQLIDGLLHKFQKRYYVEFPDMLDGIDVLSGLKGSEEVLFDLMDYPEDVKRCIKEIDDIYLSLYNKFYEKIKDERGGSIFWMWAPGKMVKQQCDFSAMISTDMFQEFVLPEMIRVLDNMDYAMYHLDGVNAIRHFDYVFSIKKIKTLQWTPGAGQEPPYSEQWFDLYHRAIEKDKNIYIYYIPNLEQVLKFKKEFGKDFYRFSFNMGVKDDEEAKKVIEECYI